MEYHMIETDGEFIYLLLLRDERLALTYEEAIQLARELNDASLLLEEAQE